MNILVIKVERLDIFHHLCQSGCDGEAGLVRNRAVEYVEIAHPVLQARLKIAVAHSQLVKIAQHGQIGLCFHGKNPPV